MHTKFYANFHRLIWPGIAVVEATVEGVTFAVAGAEAHPA